jgi:DnaJ-class molecular chaperone
MAMNWRTLNIYTNRIEQLRRLDSHDLLGVARHASEAHIRAAYRKHVRIYHPDAADPFLKPHCEEVMKLLNAAYRSMLSQVRR